MKKYTLIAAAVLVALCANAFAQTAESILQITDEAALLSIIQAPGEEPTDIFTKNIACKRLAIIGTDASIPALVAMLPSEKLNFNARFALEAMTSDASANALIKASAELTGAPQIGVIDSIAVRSLSTAVPTLVGLLVGASPELKKAIYIALGYIASDDAIAALTAEQAKPLPEEFPTKAALADSLFNAAETLRLADNNDKALEIYDSLVANEGMPMFVRKAAAYNGLLTLGPKAADRVREKMLSDKACCFSGGLKTLREYDEATAAPIFEAVNSVFEQLPPERQALILFALRELKDNEAKKAYLPKLFAALDSDNEAVKIATVRALGNVGSVDPAATAEKILKNKSALDGNAEYLDAAVEAIVALPDGVNEYLATLADNADVSHLPAEQVTYCKAGLKIIELRRVAAWGPKLVTIATTDGVDAGVRDGALAALSEIVTLDKLNLLVDALAGETDDAKVDWILRAACTRLPREDCAKKVGEMFDAADLEGKIKLLPLLKQIGGTVALAKVEAACYAPETADKASEILGQWNTPDDIEPLGAACLKLAKEGSSNKYKVRGIRSYIRIPRQFNLPAEQRFAMCSTAFETATRSEDKLLIFEIFKRVVEAKSATAALEYTSFDEYKEPACEAAVVVAEKVQGTNDELKAAMEKVVATTANDDLKARAQKVLERK